VTGTVATSKNSFNSSSASKPEITNRPLSASAGQRFIGKT